MEHIMPELLQRYLHGEADLTEINGVDEHLSRCPSCQELLAQTAADDSLLTTALVLDAEDAAWANSLDLTQSVLHKVTPWFRHPPSLLTALILLATGAWGLAQMTALFGRLIPWDGLVGLTIKLGPSLARGVWWTLVYISEGGLLASLWPALALAAGYVWRLYQKEVSKNHA